MNIINAIINIVNNSDTVLTSYYSGRNRANDEGSSLEEYVKNIFANTFNMPESERLEHLDSVFSYLGNNSNPPDAMLRNGDAIEVKKIEKNNAKLALNSSYPKNKLFSSSTMISSACRTAESWTEKDIIYAVGIVKNNQLKHFCMVYGTDYCASSECYERIKSTIKTGIEAIPNVEFAESKELGRINKIDPLGITYLRIRGMWGIEDPWNVFNYIYERDMSNKFTFMCIINEDKWHSFINTKELLQLEQITPNLHIKNVKIKNPDNPARLKPAKLITYYL